MANTTLTQTGAQVQSDLNKVEGLAEIKTIGSGLTLSSSGELSSSGGGVSFGRIYVHYVPTSYGDEGNFRIDYLDGTSDSSWNTQSQGVVYIDTIGPFRFVISMGDTVSNCTVVYGSALGYDTDAIPFVLISANTVQLNYYTGSDLYGLNKSIATYTLIGKDLHIYYIDHGRKV